jgi:hypothetical protein
VGVFEFYIGTGLDDVEKVSVDFQSIAQLLDNLLKQLGHGSTEMLRKSYKRAVSKEEAERFWSIFPPK